MPHEVALSKQHGSFSWPLNKGFSCLDVTYYYGTNTVDHLFPVKFQKFISLNLFLPFLFLLLQFHLPLVIKFLLLECFFSSLSTTTLCGIIIFYTFLISDVEFSKALPYSLSYGHIDLLLGLPYFMVDLKLSLF